MYMYHKYEEFTLIQPTFKTITPDNSFPCTFVTETKMSYARELARYETNAVGIVHHAHGVCLWGSVP